MDIPKGWHQITLNHLSNIQVAQAMTEGNEIDQSVRILSALSKEPMDKCYKLKLSEITKLLNSVNWLTNLPSILVKEFKLNDENYSIVTDVYGMGAGRYADFKTKYNEYLKEQNTYHLADCLAIMTNKGEQNEYDSTQVKDRAELFYDHLTMDIIWPYSGFFLTLYNESLKATQHYIEKEANKVIREAVDLMVEQEK